MTETVYIVDDDPVIRSAFGELMTTAGLEVETFADGMSFLSACRHKLPGCVVLDMAMPGMSGDKVQALLNERDAQVPVVFLTAHGDVPRAVRALQAGAVDFLEKPLAGAVLLERVYRALALNAERRQTRLQAQRVQRRYTHLTPREREVMARVVSGLGNKDVAAELQLSRRTVETHRAHVMHKMKANNVADLIHMSALVSPHSSAAPAVPLPP